MNNFLFLSASQQVINTNIFSYRFGLALRRILLIGVFLFSVTAVRTSFAAGENISPKQINKKTVSEKLEEIGLEKNYIEYLSNNLSPSEIEYLASNPELFQELGATYQTKQEQDNEAAAAIVSLILLGFTLTWMSEMMEKK